jgi:hypothetical protein
MPSEIERFVRLLRDKLSLANHWDIWALAYIAQDAAPMTRLRRFDRG